MNKLKSIFHKNNKHRTAGDDNNDQGEGDHYTPHTETSKKLEKLSLNDRGSFSGDEIVSIHDSDISSTQSDTVGHRQGDREVGENQWGDSTDGYLNSEDDGDASSCLTSSSFSASLSEEGEGESRSGSENEEQSRMNINNYNDNTPLFLEQNELSDYKLLEKIGEGAFSKVFKGVNLVKQGGDKEEEEYVAIKIIKKENLSMDNAGGATNKSSTKLQQVLKEVTLHKMVTSLQCDNIVKFIEFKETKSFYYIIQELLTGGEIFNSIVKYTYFSEDLSRHVIIQLGHAIQALHSIGVVHRDIKPENLLFQPIEYIPRDQPILRKSDDPMTKLDEGIFEPGVGGGGIGVVKLTDFGLSKQIYQTNTKTPCGTVGYTAPEVVKDEKYSMKVDMWGVGCVLYTMLCGFPPFYDEKIDILTEKISRGEYTFLKPWWDEISDDAKRCVARLLEVDPDKRYTIEEFMEDPWLNKYTDTSVKSVKSSGGRKRYVPSMHRVFHEDPSLLYSPVAVAMRDAFDISNAVKRNEVVTGGGHKRKQKMLYSLDEEMEEGEEQDKNDTPVVDPNNTDTDTDGFSKQLYQQDTNNMFSMGPNLFELNLNTSTIIQRRQKKQRMASPLATNIPIMSERVRL